MIARLSDVQLNTTRVLPQSVGDRWWYMADFPGSGVGRPPCAVDRVGDELWLSGEIDESNADVLSTRVAAEALAGMVCLDLSQVRFFSAAGVRMMFAIRAAGAPVADGIRVVCSPEVARTLRVCRLTHVDGLRFITPETRDGGDGARR